MPAGIMSPARITYIGLTGYLMIHPVINWINPNPVKFRMDDRISGLIGFGAHLYPEGPSEKDLSNNLPSDLEELTKVFEKNLEALENMVKLIKSDVSKMFDISDSSFPSSSINASPEK